MSATRRRVTMTQLLHLWEFLNNHREIAVGYNKSTQAREHSKRMWERAAEILNSAGEGAIKSGSEWSKYWVDLKAKLKRKNRLINDSRRRTGGGPAIDVELSELDRKFLSILGEDYGTGLSGVQVDPLVPLVSQEYEDIVAGPSNPDTSQSTATEEAMYLIVQTSEEYQQNEPVRTSQNSYEPEADSPVPTVHRLRQGTPGLSPRRLVLPEEADHPASPSRQGTTGSGPRRRLILPAEANTPASPSRRGTSGQGSRSRLVLPVIADPPHSGSGQSRPRRYRRRHGQSMSVADARERLVTSTERRAEAELANSRSIERCMGLLGDIVSVLRNIQDRMPGGAPTDE